MATTFEEQVENYCKYGPWKGGDKQRILDPDWNDERPRSASTTPKSNIEDDIRFDFSRSALTKSRNFGKVDASEMTNWQLWNPVGHPKVGDTEDSMICKPTGTQKDVNIPAAVLQDAAARPNIGDARPVGPLQKLDRTQSHLATQMFNTLRGLEGDGAKRIVEAVSTFHKAFQRNMSVQVNQVLLDACILLGQECDHYDKLDVFIPVLSKILSFGYPIDEETLYKLQARKVIIRLLEQSGYRHSNSQVVMNVDKLKHAVAIFIVKTREKPKPLPMELRDVGLQLCTATLRANLYELTEAVYWRLLCARTDITASEVECLILAEHRRACWDQVLHHFSKYFSRTVPNQNQLYAVVSAAIDSALELGRIDAAEEILSTASQMARNGNLRTSTKWHLRVLGDHWRIARDIKATQALFKRLEAFNEQTSHPQAFYSAMIQFCIEAGSESEAQQYLERLRQLGSGDNMDVRTYGHLALAKAMRNDWPGVEADFCFMKKFAKGSTREHSDIFVPILKLFVASHDVGQVEGFIRLYLEDLDVAPNQYIFNIVVDTYCKAGELSNIPRWIEYARKHGLQVDAVTFNTILSRCRKQWAVHPDDLFQLYKETNKKVGPIFDSTTIQILRRAASSSATPYRAARLIRQVRPPTGAKYEKMEAEMRRALERGDDTKVLKSYKFAMQSGKRVSPQGFSIAVRASIRSAADGNLTSTVKLITDARSRGFDILPSVALLLLHQVNTSKCDGDDLASLVKHTLAEFDKRGLTVTLSIASKVIGELIDRGRPEEALMLWKTMASHDHIARQPVDLVLLTVLLRAHIMLSDIAGIKWVMAVLLDNNIIPDKHFKLVIKRARQEARRFFDAQPDSFDAKQRYEILDECMRLVVAQRANGEARRKEAVQLTLSIVETALAAEPQGAQAESGVGLSEGLRVKRSQRLRNPKKIWERLGKYSKFNRHPGMTNMVESIENDGTRYPESSPPMVQEGETGLIEGQEVTGREFLGEQHVRNVGRMGASPKTKQAVSGWTESDIKHSGGYHNSLPRTVEVASG